MEWNKSGTVVLTNKILPEREKINMQEKPTSFGQYSLSPSIIDALELLGYLEPTDIQKKVIPLIMEGKNVVARSGTGTGKTAAFAIPVCESVEWEKNLPQAIVLEPSRELAVQVSRELFHIGRRKRLKVPAVFGGFPIDKQIQTLKQKTHIVVGTPGRVMDHIRRDSLKLSEIRFLIIDEADLMLDMGFLEEVKQILSFLPAEKQTLLFSATLDEKVKSLTDECLSDAVTVMPEPEDEIKPLIYERLYRTSPEEKYGLFRRILIQENPESCMIFCGTREMVNVLFRKMRRDRIFCGMLHGEIDQKERLKTVEAFRRGAFRFLIATDVAARGIDFDKITHVINYDFPTGRETYVHRIGRTGRNGSTGNAVSLVCESDEKMLKMVEEYTGTELPISQNPDPDESQEKAFWARQKQKNAPKNEKEASLNQTITRLSIGGGRKSKMRAADIVGTICSLKGMEVQDIGIIDVRESLTYVEILNGKGPFVIEELQNKTIKGKVRKVRASRASL